MIAETNYVEKRQLQKANSIYRGLNGINSFLLQFAELGAIINLNGYIIGSDKLGHFIGMGWEYFKIARLKGKGLIKSLTYGQQTERSFFGKMTTGIYSYADLAANYDGYLFWNDLLDSEYSPSTDPHIVCIKGELIKIREFDWGDYITDAWDEAVNCNTFRTKAIKNKVEKEILRLEERDPRNRYQCPIRGCGELKTRYPDGHLNC